MEIIIGRAGNQKTPISDRTVSHKHCKVTPNGDGTYTIENLSQAGTKIDGQEIIRAKAGLHSRIQLGQTFSATLVELIGVPETDKRPQTQPKAPQSPPQKEMPTFDISHLRQVWDSFNQTNIQMADAQRKAGLVRGGGIIFTTGGGLIATLTAIPVLGIVFSVIGIVSIIYSFNGMRKSETAAERQERRDAFELEWVCPNPDCRKPLPPKSYRVLVRTYKECPYCKCRYVEK